MTLDAIALTAAHPNRIPFRGLLTQVDQPSDRSPSGARGHRVNMTRVAAERALPTLLGMAVNFHDKFDRHDAQQKIGIITAAEVSAENEIHIGGFLYAKDFPAVTETLKNDVFGMSYEIADAHIADLHAEVWQITDFIFTGAAVLRRDKASYRSTWFAIQSAANA